MVLPLIASHTMVLPLNASRPRVFAIEYRSSKGFAIKRESSNGFAIECESSKPLLFGLTSFILPWAQTLIIFPAGHYRGTSIDCVSIWTPHHLCSVMQGVCGCFTCCWNTLCLRSFWLGMVTIFMLVVLVSYLISPVSFVLLQVEEEKWFGWLILSQHLLALYCYN